MKTALSTLLLTHLMLGGFAGMAMAADKSVAASTDVNSGTFAVERMICSKLYVPATGNQSPTYQAGIDAQGKSVVPADINPSADATPDYVEVPMTVDLAKRMGINQVGAEMQMPVANLKLYKDGRVEYNGQDVSSNASDMCGSGKKSDVSKPSRTMADVKSTPSMIEPAAGQDQMLAAPSTTTHPDPRNQYQSDSVAPDQVEPQAGSVAASATNSPAPKTPVQIQRSTVNMAPRASQY